ncbi:hypothetical protein ROZALSC1DRAFT_9766, partial [Rozella allomycis CSF55]
CIGKLFVVLSIACGLLYITEFIEEHTVYTKKCLKILINAVIVSHIIVWVSDSISFFRTLFSIFCHVYYLHLLDDFPNIDVTSPKLIISALLAVIDHFVWFFYFTSYYFAYSKKIIQVATFFSLFVWLVPFLFFVSLGANENVIPSSGK